MPIMILVIAVPAAVDYANGWWKSASDCQVTRVVDGDTVEMSCTNVDANRLRFAGIDTPELHGDCAKERLLAVKARVFVEAQLLQASEVEIRTTGRFDRYGRALGTIWLDGQSLETALLAADLAVPYVPGDIGWCERIERGLI